MAEQQNTREAIEIGDEIVIFNYTNTKAKCSGTVIGLTEYHVQIRAGHWGSSDWFPLEDAAKVRRAPRH